MSAGLAALALVSACGSADGPRTTEGGSAGNAGNAGAGSQAGAVGKGGSEGNQSGSGSGGDSESSGGKGGSSGGSTTGGGAGGGVGSPCRADADCPVAIDLYCSPPGAAPGCGACPGEPFNACSTDLDCRTNGENEICERPCGGICPMGSCVPGCTEETVCPIGTVCGTAGRCQASACTVREDCPPDFDCHNSGCFRRPCDSDAECDGYCVTDACYSALGACVRPAA
jgi:hypothetical protein